MLEVRINDLSHFAGLWFMISNWEQVVVIIRAAHSVRERNMEVYHFIDVQRS